MCKLPKLFFFENHSDPTTKRVLTKLLPRLKKLGYVYFYHEMPSDITSEDFFKEEFIVSEECAKFIKALSLNQIPYKAIDLKIIRRIEKAVGEIAGWDIVRALNTVREKNIAHVFMKAVHKTFGILGVMHCEGIQKEILQHFSNEQASEEFCFFYVYSNDELQKHFQLDLSGNADYPLGLSRIQASHKSDEEIIEEIVRQIEVKKSRMDSKSLAQSFSMSEQKIPYKAKEMKVDFDYNQAANRFISDFYYSKVRRTALRDEGITTILEPIFSKRDDEMIDARLDFLNYIREREDEPEYYGFWGRLTGMSKSLKIRSAKKMLSLLKGEKTSPFLDNELDALRNSELGKITSKLEDKKILPHEFVACENGRILREARLLK